MVELLWSASPRDRLSPSGAQEADVSVIIPCRNEEIHVEGLLSALLALKPKPREIIVVDDQSTDRTRDLVSKVARANPHIILLSVTEKPKDWVGKTWACQMGADFATSKFLLFLDADVRPSPGSLNSALNLLSANNAQMMSAVPQVHGKLYWEGFQGSFWILVLAVSHQPKFGNRFCIGHFLLMTHESYLQVGGHQSVKEDAADDIGLLRRMEAKQLNYAVHPPGLFSVDMYPDGIVSFLRGWTRIFRLGMRRNNMLSNLVAFLLLAFLLGPIVSVAGALVSGPASLGLVARREWLSLCLGCAFMALTAYRVQPSHRWHALFYPLAIVVFLLVSVMAALTKLFRQPIRWRGRIVPE